MDALGYLGICGDPAESSRVRIRGQTNMGNIVVSVCYRPPDHKGVDEAFFRQLACWFKACSLGALNHPEICWRDNTAGDKQSRGFCSTLITF